MHHKIEQVLCILERNFLTLDGTHASNEDVVVRRTVGRVVHRYRSCLTLDLECPVPFVALQDCTTAHVSLP